MSDLERLIGSIQSADSLALPVKQRPDPREGQAGELLEAIRDAAVEADAAYDKLTVLMAVARHRVVPPVPLATIAALTGLSVSGVAARTAKVSSEDLAQIERQLAESARRPG